MLKNKKRKRIAERKRLKKRVESLSIKPKSTKSVKPLKSIEPIESMQDGLTPGIFPEEGSEYYDTHIPEDLSNNVYWRRLYDKVL